MTQINNCPLCEEPSVKVISTDLHKQYNCQRCGDFTLLSLLAQMEPERFRWQHNLSNKRTLANIRGWIRENFEPRISAERLLQLSGSSTPSVAERGIKVLNFLNDQAEEAGNWIKLQNFPKLITVAWASTKEELHYILTEYLGADKKFLEIKHPISPEIKVRITPAGYAYLDSLKQINSDSNIAFCAMWFDNSLDRLWDEAIEPAINGAGYQPVIIRKHPYNGGVVDEIISKIRRSKFIIADLTGNRGGVYYEAGFAQGLGLPTIFTCDKSYIDRKDLHFDVQHYNFLCWEKGMYDEFKDCLQTHIEATLGRGKNKELI